MTTGPFLYDEGPAPLHTGTPRRRQGLLLAIFGGTALVAVLMVLALFLVKGTPEEQAHEAVVVFISALDAGDTETAHQLLCEEERARLAPGDVAAQYLGDGAAMLIDAGRTGSGGERHVTIRWEGGGSSAWRVISEDGARVCGVIGAR